MKNQVHVKIFVKLLHDVTDVNLRHIKEYLKTSGLLSERENDTAKDVTSLWEIMNRYMYGLRDHQSV
jgi:hypothetical protein